jgi:lipid-binding SYLF domain-containing protein
MVMTESIKEAMGIGSILRMRMVSGAAAAAVLVSLLVSSSAQTASASEIRRDAAQALSTLYQTTPDARALAERSRAILIFPHIVAGALGIGVQYGDGALHSRARR